MFFLVEVTGLAPLAARPGAQPTGLCSLLPRFLFPAPFANRSLPFAPPPSSPVRMQKLQKKTHRSIRWVFLVEVTGLAPLAARPGAQPTGLCSLLPRFLFPAPFANRSLPFAPPPSSPVRMQKLQKKTHRSIRWVFLVEVTGLAPLAARPGAQPTGLCSLLPRFLFPAPFANRSLPFAPPPSSPVRMLKLQKKTHRSIRWVFFG